MNTQENTHAMHSVTNYLNSLVWDGTPRLDRWLVNYAGAEDTERTRAAGRLMLLAAVRRARQPGCRFEQLPVLAGPQGCGKSSALRVLAVNDAWYSATAPLPLRDAEVRQLIEATAGKWIVEVSELDNARPLSVKVFLSQTHDQARMAYQREVSVVPRAFVSVGTSGSAEAFLHDPAMDRRIVVVQVTQFDLDRLFEIRDQLWAEAAAAEASGESIQWLFVEGS